MRGKELNTGFSTEVQWLGLSTVLKTVSFQLCTDQRHVKYVKINRSRQLALDGVVDTHMDVISNDTGASPTYYLLFSSLFFLLLFTTLSHKTPIMYFEWRWQYDFGVSNLVTTLLIWLDSTRFVLLGLVTLIETICSKFDESNWRASLNNIFAQAH